MSAPCPWRESAAARSLTLDPATNAALVHAAEMLRITATMARRGEDTLIAEYAAALRALHLNYLRGNPPSLVAAGLAPVGGA